MCVLFICVLLWEIEFTLPMRWHTSNSLGRFFSHRTHRFNRTFLRTVSNPQNASGIQKTQSVSAIVDSDKGQQAAYIQLTWVSQWSRPFPSGEGKGGPAWVGGGASCVIVLSRCSFPHPFLSFLLLQYVNIFTLLKLSMCFSWFKNMPSNVQIHAFLAYWRALSCIKRGVFFKSLCNCLISCELYAHFFEVITSLIEVAFIELL